MSVRKARRESSRRDIIALFLSFCRIRQSHRSSSGDVESSFHGWRAILEGELLGALGRI